MKITAIITAAGNGSRTGFTENKVLQKIDGLTVLERSVKPFLENKDVDEVIITSSPKDKEVFLSLFKNTVKPLTVVIGGTTRSQSVLNALNCVKEGFVIIHDGARPFVSARIIEDCIKTVCSCGSAVTCIEPVDTIALTNQEDKIVSSGRNNVLCVQTPQAFDVKLLKDAFKQIKDDDVFTDESGLFAKYVGPVTVVKGDKDNVKLTYKKDFLPAEEILVGTGFDLHTLVEGRKLILAGEEIPHSKGLLGHSDADVLAHAIMDAILSACHMRDIGYHFSDKDPQYKDISSMLLFEKVMQMITQKGYKVNNVSAVIMAEKPKLSTYVPKLSTNIAQVVHISEDKVGITCTTLEGIGIVGREEGIAVQAYCSVSKI